MKKGTASPDRSEAVHPPGRSARAGASHQVCRPVLDVAGPGGADRLAPDGAGQTEISHQARHSIAPHLDAFTEKLSRDLLDTVDGKVLTVHSTDLAFHFSVANAAARGLTDLDGIVSTPRSVLWTVRLRIPSCCQRAR